MIDREIYFEMVRIYPFNGGLTQRQVDGQNFILDTWEKHCHDDDPRWLAYFLATTYHETSAEMWPIEEYGKGQGYDYGVPDPVTGETYYGRGFVQLTWGDNYDRADKELDFDGEDSCYQHADNALDPIKSARIGYLGMVQAWFRSGNSFAKFFSETADDPYEAREIINGDKSKIPSWSNGISIGNLIAGYHDAFLEAIYNSWSDEPLQIPPEPETGEPDPTAKYSKTIVVTSDSPVHVSVLQVQLKDGVETERKR